MNKKKILASVVTGVTAGIAVKAVSDCFKKRKESKSEASSLDFVDDSIPAEYHEDCMAALRFLREYLDTDAPLNVYEVCSGDLGAVYGISGNSAVFTVLRVGNIYEVLSSAYDTDDKYYCGKTVFSLGICADHISRVVAYVQDELGTDGVEVVSAHRLKESYVYTVNADGQQYDVYVEGDDIGFVVGVI